MTVPPFALPAGCFGAVQRNTTMASYAVQAPPPAPPSGHYDYIEDYMQQLSPPPAAWFGAVPLQRTTMATYAAQAPPPAPPCVYDGNYDVDAVNMETLLGNIHDFDFEHQPAPPASLLPKPRGPLPFAEFLALSSWPPDNDADFEDYSLLLRGVKTLRIAATTGGFAAPLASHDDDTPRTPVAVLHAPFSYGDDGACCTDSVVIDTTKTEEATPKKKKDPSWTYDADIDATLRMMEKDPAERPSEDYLWTTQQGTRMNMGDRAQLVKWMYASSRSRIYGVPPGTVHRAVSYVDRFLSDKKIGGAYRHQYLILICGAAVFAAAKYEDKMTKWVLNADDVARDIGGGCTRRQVLYAERDLLATLGYRLSGPTAYTFVDHFTRHDDDDDDHAALVRSLAHHLADVTLLDCRCLQFLPSAVATSAILLARRVVVGACFLVPPPQALSKEEELLEMTGYSLKDLADIMQVIYDMHEHKNVWPGCTLMMDNCAYIYTLPPR